MPDETMRADACPMCGGKGSMRHSHDEDGCRWSFIQCGTCGLRTRGKWVSHSSDECPLYFQEVWAEWCSRASAAPAVAPVVNQSLATAAPTADYWEPGLYRTKIPAPPRPPRPSDAGQQPLLRKALSALLSLSADCNGFEDNEEYGNERETIDMIRAAISESEGSSNG